MIATRVFDIRDFNATNKLSSFVVIKVGPLYIISFWFSYTCLGFLYLGTLVGFGSFIELFVVKLFMKILG